MNTIIQSERPMSHLPEIARSAAESARETFDRFADDAKKFTGVAVEAARDAVDSGEDAVKHASDTAREAYRSAARKTGDSLETSEDYVRRHPVPVVLGAVVLGAALGYLLVTARRKPTFGERYADEPIFAARDAILGALAPVTRHIRNGYDSALDGAGETLDRVHRFNPGHAAHSFSDHIGRIGENLKFW
jgi:ElaB/YqjD/DUF883 family membrane-anchored ribosome-binding protein